MKVNLEKLSPQEIPDGKYNAVWGGFSITLSDQKSEYFGMHFASDIGIKTIHREVVIVIKDGNATLDTKYVNEIKK